MARLGSLTAALVLVTAACLTASDPTTPIAPPTSMTAPTTTSTTAATLLGSCAPGEPRIGIDNSQERIIELYNRRDAERLVILIGDGPVRDPSLDPLGPSEYPNIEAWVEAAEFQGDVWENWGYGFGEPFQLYVSRTNRALISRDIDGLFLQIRLWVNQDCEFRVETGEPVSFPTACAYADQFVEGSRPECLGEFLPRAGHTAVWADERLLVFGGTQGGYPNALAEPGFDLHPVTGRVEQLPPVPIEMEWWPNLRAVWTGTEALVFGWQRGDGQPSIAAYDPGTESWRVSEFPEERTAIGATVWTGDELLFVGGDLHYPDNSAWAFDPLSDEWRQLPDPGIPDVEGIEGVWTGSEAIFFGGYTMIGHAIGVAFDPRTGTWRPLPETSYRSVQRHFLVWTGDRMIVASGHVGPEHPDTLLIYDRPLDAWSQSAPMPMPPSERGAVVWTGEEVIIWGGYATYGEGHVNGLGAAYNPETDEWRVLSPSPLPPRCDHTGTWTGDVVVILGGMSRCGEPGGMGWSDGAIYDPETDEWRPLQPESDG